MVCVDQAKVERAHGEREFVRIRVETEAPGKPGATVHGRGLQPEIGEQAVHVGLACAL